MRSALAFGLAASSLLFLGSHARAEMAVCNDFRAPIRVALAYESQGGFTAAGWWSVKPGACEPIDFAFQGGKLYYTAGSDQYREGRFTKRDHWGNKIKLFVSPEKFRFENAERSRRGAKAETFSYVEISPAPEGKRQSITFHFRSGGTSIEIKTGN